MFLATILFLGTLNTILPSAQADSYLTENWFNRHGPEPEYVNNNIYEPIEYPSYQQEYSSDNSYYKFKDSSKSVSINKIKCNNINVNVNGLELDVLPPFLGGEVATTASDGETGANSFANNGDGSQINDFRFICINNNNNTVVGEEPSVLPEKTNATLMVTKTVTCSPTDTLPPAIAECQELLSIAPPSSFNIFVTGNNPNPSEFAGSNVPVIVTLGAGNYEITENLPNITSSGLVDITLTTSFAGDCTDEGTGTIEAGESQTCRITNNYVVSTIPRGLTASNINTDASSFDINTSGGLASSFSSPLTIAQESTEDNLSALEKITKLKK